MGRSSFFIVFLILIFSGCKSNVLVFDNSNIERLNRSEVVQKIVDQGDNFENVFFRRCQVKIKNSKGVQSFKSNIYLNVDSFIRVSVLAPMGIEVARVSFEKEGVKVIDRMNRVVIYTGYGEVNRKFGASFDFFMLQNILLDQPFSYEYKQGKKLDGYYYDFSDSQYVLSSFKEKKYNRLVEKEKASNIIFHRIWIDPTYFLMKRTQLTSGLQDMDLDIKYDAFKELDNGIYFPEKLNIQGKMGNENVSVIVSYGNVQFNDDNGISFKIPEKYEKVYR